MPKLGPNEYYMTEEVHENNKDFQRFFDINSYLDKDINADNPELHEKTQNVMDEFSSSGVRKNVYMENGNRITYHSLNGEQKFTEIHGEKIIKDAKEANAGIKSYLEEIIKNPDEKAKPFVAYYKCLDTFMDPEFDYLKFSGETQYTHLGNLLTGIPNFRYFEPEEFKEKLGEAYQPLIDLYENYSELLLLEKDFQKLKKEGKEPEKEHIDRKIKILDGFTEAYDKLLALPEETRKKLDDKLLQNEIDHMLGKGEDDRSPFRTVAGMKEEAKALKHGYNNEEAKLFYMIGRAKGTLERGNFVLEKEKNKVLKSVADAEKSGIQKFNEKELKDYEELRNTVNNTRTENLTRAEEVELSRKKNIIRENRKRYLYTISDKKIKDFDKKIAENNKSINNLDKSVGYGLGKNPENTEEKLKAFNNIKRVLLEDHKDKVIHGAGKKSFGAVFEELDYLFDDIAANLDKQKQALEEKKEAERLKEYDAKPENREKIFADLFAKKIKSNSQLAKNEIKDYIQMAELPEDSKKLSSKEFMDKLNADAEKINKYIENKEIIGKTDSLIDRSRSVGNGNHNFVKDAIESVRRGNSIGWFTKKDYGDILQMLTDFNSKKFYRDVEMKDHTKLGADFRQNIKGNIVTGKVLDQNVINEEQAILDAMDKYLKRKNKEIQDAKDSGRKPNSNSVKRRDIMLQAREAFAEQMKIDKELLDVKDRIPEIEAQINSYENEKKAVLDNSKNVIIDEPGLAAENGKKNKFEMKIAEEESKLQKKIADFTENESNTYGVSDKEEIKRIKNEQKQLKDNLKNDMFIFACKAMYIDTMNEIAKEKFSGDKKEFEKAENDLLSDFNINKGAGMIKTKMDALRGVEKQFKHDLFKASNEGITNLNVKTVKQTFNNMMDGFYKQMAVKGKSDKQADRETAKQVNAALDKISIVAGSKLKSEQYQPEAKKKLNIGPKKASVLG